MSKDLCDSSYIDLGGTIMSENNCPECFLEKLREQLWENEGGAVKKDEEE
jgi:hypothetical protein